MADRNKPGYMNFDDIADRIESGKLNAYDTVYTKDTHEVVFIKEDKSLIRMKCRLDVYPSVVVAEYNLNLNTDTYVGQIVGIEDGEWVRLYNVNYADDKFIVKKVGVDEYGQLTNKPQINGVTLEGNKTTEQLGINIPTKFSQLYDDIGYETINHLVANYYSKTETYSKTEADGLFATQNSVPTDLADLQDDSTHRLVTDEDKYRWNNPTGNIQSDWNTTDPADGSYIKNKPSLFSGNYNDLSNKPDIPNDLADLNDDTNHRLVTDSEKTAWNGKSNFSGSYTDLSNKPTLADLSTDSGHRTVSDSEKSTWNSKSDFSGSYNDLSNKPSIPDDLTDLDDISISNIQNGQILRYNSTTQKFENSNESGGTVSSAYKKIKVASSEIIASGEDTLELVAGTNVTLVPDTVNKKVTINSSGGGGGTSTGDMLKSIYDTNNDGIVNAADEAATLTGLDATVTELNALDGVTSNVQEQLNAKADSSDVPTALSDLSDDSTHRLVTDTEKTTWNGKSDFSGSYNDLTDKPSIPDDLADLNDDSTHRLVTDTEKSIWNAKSDFSGSYADLTNKPTIPSALADLSDDSTHRLVTDTEKTTWSAGEANVQSNWNETDTDSDAYIQNKPTIPSVVANPDNTTATLTSLGIDGTNYAIQGGGGGAVDSVNGKTGEVVLDATDVGALPDSTPLFSGDYNDLTNKPTIPDDLADLNDDSTHRLVTDTEKTTWNGKSDFSGSYTDLTNKPTLGTASALDVASSGDASTTEVVKGDDSRLSDSRTPVSHTHTTSDITDFPTMSDYIQKSNTSGLVKNDGTIDTNSYATTSQIPDITGKADKVTSAVGGNFAGLDSNGNLVDSGHKHSDYLTQHQDISGKADKVSSATNGNLAGLNGSGNLTDSGWNGAKDTTSISGNPISISGLKSNQLAVNPIITLEPIQAGSGTPSPSNIRAISGYDKIEVLSANGSDPTAQGYVKVTDISESLGQTVYGGSLDVRTGVLTVTWKKATFRWGDGSSSASLGSNTRRSFGTLDGLNDSASRGLAISDKCPNIIAYDQDSTHFYISSTGTLYVFSPNNTDADTTFDVCYLVATPTEIQLTPHEISLLKDYAYVSTNGTNISLDYHNGEIASLADVAQLSETVENAWNVHKSTLLGRIELSNDYTEQNYFTTPADGYLYVYTPSAAVRAVVRGDNTTDSSKSFAVGFLTAQSGASMTSLYLRKGMKVHIHQSQQIPTGGIVAFFPFM